MLRLPIHGFTRTPLRLSHAYQVLQLEDTQPLDPPLLSEVRDELRFHLESERVEDAIADLRRWTVGSAIPVSAARVRQLAAALDARSGAALAAARAQAVRNVLVLRDARRRRLDRDPEVRVQQDLARRQALAQAWTSDHVASHPVDENAVDEAYRAFLAARNDGREYRLRSIRVAERGQALNLIDRLKRGEPVDEMRSETGSEPSAAARWVPESAFPPDVAAQLRRLGKGDVVDAPAQADGAYYVSVVADVRPLRLPPADQVRTEIRERLREQALRDAIDSLYRNATIASP